MHYKKIRISKDGEVHVARAGGSMTREQLAEQLDISFVGGYGSNTLGALRTAGIVDYPEKSTVGPSDLLFPEGLV